MEDEHIGQLINILHRKIPEEKDKKLRVGKLVKSDRPPLTFVVMDMRGIIARWVRAFHAALYGEYLPKTVKEAIHPPFPSAVPTDDGILDEPIPTQHHVFVDTLKKNRVAGSIDGISCYNGKCIYECVWDRFDDGSWFCIFAIKVYDWSRLSDKKNYSQRGCVGFYQPDSGVPATATRATSLHFPYRNVNQLDAHEE